MSAGDSKSFSQEYGELAALWTLRLVCGLQGNAAELFPSGKDEIKLLRAVGIADCDEHMRKEDFEVRLRARLTELENQKIARDGVVDKNVQALAPYLGLNRTECELLVFAIVDRNMDWMYTVTRNCSLRSYAYAPHALAIALALPEEEVRTALHPDSILAATETLKVADERYAFSDRLVINREFNVHMILPQADPAVFLRNFFYHAPAPMLAVDDYPHARTEWGVMSGYLAAACQAKRRGVNILVHGHPGSGKTELVRAICAALHLELDEVASENTYRKPLRPAERLAAYFLAERVLSAQQNQVLLFDDAEDAFPSHFAAMLEVNASSEGAPINKARMNHALEENPVPAFWVTNGIRNIDPAYLRRFDLVIKMPPPTRSVRKALLKRYLHGLPVSEAWVDQAAENDVLMPSVIERAGKVAQALATHESEMTKRNVELALQGSVEAMGHTLRMPRADNHSFPYRLEYLNADVDLETILEGLKHQGQGRLCLYGPPGTGKTAFVRHLAKVLDRPLLQKRASDLLSKWVGESEKHIAGMFREAERERAVLLLDEADSFLQDRKYAQHFWQVTQVNELLTRMEEYDRLFIAATNLVDNLDPASLRRFDFKIKFDYLRLEQRKALFLEYFPAGDTMCPDMDDRLNIMDTLTPGDFAVLARRSRIIGYTMTAGDALTCLEGECSIKTGNKRRSIGFVG